MQISLSQTARLFSAIMVLAWLAGCGSSSNSPNTSEPSVNGTDATLTSTPINATAPNTTPGTTSEEDPILLSWPADFPAEIPSQEQLVHVTGVPINKAYEFSVAPGAGYEEFGVMFVFNNRPNERGGVMVCADELSCTGTVIGPDLILTLVGYGNTDTITLSIEESDERPLFDQGSKDERVIISAQNNQLVAFQGSVGALPQDSGNNEFATSYYRIAGLTVGDKYRLSSAYTFAHYPDGSELICDPQYATENCVFIAAADAIDIDFVSHDLFGTAVDIEIEYINSPNGYDGNWDAPLLLATPRDGKTIWLGKANKYSSYYSLTDLDPLRRYKISLFSRTSAAKLRLNSPLTSRTISTCPAVNPDNSILDKDACVIERSIYAYFRVESLEGDVDYLLSIEVGPEDQGTPSTPLAMQTDTQGNLTFEAAVNRSSHYNLYGLNVGQYYLLRVTADSKQPSFGVSLPDTQAVDCVYETRNACIFVAPANSVNLSIENNNPEFGEYYQVDLNPQPAIGPEWSAPEDEHINLSPLDFPHNGSVDSLDSVYSFTGLMPNEHYLVELQNQSNYIELQWSSPLSRQQACNTWSLARAGCLLQASADGTMDITVESAFISHRQGSFYDLYLTAPVIDGYTSTGPQSISGDSTSSLVSGIAIDSTQPALFPEVSVMIDHRYHELTAQDWQEFYDISLELEAPDGTRIMLTEQIDRISFDNVIFSDLAKRPNPVVTGLLDYGAAHRPIQPFHPLHEMSQNGIWRLHVKNNSPVTGTRPLTLQSWGISFNSEGY